MWMGFGTPNLMESSLRQLVALNGNFLFHGVDIHLGLFPLESILMVGSFLISSIVAPRFDPYNN